MKFGIVVFPGSNCDEDAFHAAKDLFGQDAEYLWHKDTELKGADVVILPGGCCAFPSATARATISPRRSFCSRLKPTGRWCFATRAPTGGSTTRRTRMARSTPLPRSAIRRATLSA